MAKPTWAPSRAVIANGKRGGAVIFAAPDSYVAHQVCEYGPPLGDLGLDDAPIGISIWEGDYVWRSTSYEYPLEGDEDPVGAFRAPTDDEWAAIREGRNPWGEEPEDEPDIDDPNESAEAWGFGDGRSDNGNPDFVGGDDV